MNAIAEYLKNVPEMSEAYEEIAAELAKDEAKAAANRAMYESAREIVLAHMSDVPQTAAEIRDACGTELPESFTRSRVQYALTHYWTADVVKIENPKGANQYRKA